MTTFSNITEAFGNTPLVRLRGPSEETGCDIFGKCEFANPGASVKDRAALFIVRDAERQGLLKPGGVFVSSTALLGAVAWYWRILIPLAQFFGLAPYVGKFSKDELVSMLTRAGFSVDHEWQPGVMSVFIVAKKNL